MRTPIFLRGVDVKKIIKSGGHCHDGCVWFDCEFWQKDDAGSYCMLFGGNIGVKKNASKALIICDKIYGMGYTGEP